MCLIDRKRVTDAFAGYTSAYNAEDPKIKLKIDHTYRVAAMAEDIARSLKDGINTGAAAESGCGIDPDFAWLCGMLHDIGRFEQVRRYNTFSDADSVDHAGLGADLLFNEGLLDRFISDRGVFNENGDNLRLLELAIRNHSAYRIEEGLSPQEQMYCNILRDADKVDIFRVNYDTPLEDIYNTTTEELKAASVTEEVKQCFREKHCVLRALKKTPIDHLVGHICLTFELVTSRGLELAREQGYVDKLMAYQSDNPDTAQWFGYMRENLWKQLI